VPKHCRSIRPFAAALLLAAGLALASLSTAAGAATLEAAYVVLGPQGPVARAVLTGASACPRIRIGGTARRMQVRALPGKEAAFPILVCEFLIPPGAKAARVSGRLLPVPKPALRSLVTFGDSGCRIKAWEANGHEEGEFQDCNKPSSWPFALLSWRVAAMKPGLVIHVGDYLYRENPCPPQDEGCQGSPSGDNWETWKADFFTPARALLHGAPWIMVRGNHEDCKRSWGGYVLLLDPAPIPTACKTLIPQYKVTTGGRSFIVLDTSTTDDACTTNCNAKPYADEFAAMKPTPGTWLVTHKPVWAFSGDTVATPLLQQALQAWNGRLPPGVDLALAGHIHLWEALSFADKRTPQLVVGTGGSSLNPALDKPLTGRAIAGTTVSIGYTAHAWGMTVMKPAAGGAWTTRVVTADGKPLSRCKVTPTAVRCDP